MSRAWDTIVGGGGSAGCEAGHPLAADFNGHEPEGFGVFERSTHGGCHWRVARGSLTVSVRARPNLEIRTGVGVLGVTLDGARATGLRYLRDGAEERLSAGEVILSADAIGSPHILQHSGIGPAAVLEAAGIPCGTTCPAWARTSAITASSSCNGPAAGR